MIRPSRPPPPRCLSPWKAKPKCGAPAVGAAKGPPGCKSRRCAAARAPTRATSRPGALQSPRGLRTARKGIRSPSLRRMSSTALPFSASGRTRIWRAPSRAGSPRRGRRRRSCCSTPRSTATTSTRRRPRPPRPPGPRPSLPGRASTRSAKVPPEWRATRTRGPPAPGGQTRHLSPSTRGRSINRTTGVHPGTGSATAVRGPVPDVATCVIVRATAKGRPT